MTRAVDPRVGELWEYPGGTCIIFGNCVSERKTIWAMDWNTGARVDPLETALIGRADRDSLTETHINERVAGWAKNGNSDAMWWLGWWFEGRHHPKSVWYYVAAMRRDPEAFGWAQGRVSSDARSAYMQEAIPKPELHFLKEIPELNRRHIGSDWKAAVEKAETTEHVPAEMRSRKRSR